MEGQDRGDDRTFNVNFGVDGAAKLRERVNDKLQEFMGDYTDDTLVEYVIVLLKNGRHKEGAKNELNVFLGADSDSFVNWLWDHLSSNLHLYVQPRESYPDEMPMEESVLGEEAGGDDSQLLDLESEREKSTMKSKSRRNREWKGLVRDADEPPPLRSSEIESFHAEEKSHYKSGRVKLSHSPRPPVQQKRNRQDDRQESKREVPSHPMIDAPRRLLQFAVRDAVGTLRSSSSKTEPTFKRLRSVVSTSTGDSLLEDQPQRIRSVARVPSAMATAMKAAAAAAEDVTKLRGSANVFDRLGHGVESVDVSEMTNQSPEFKRTVMEDAEYENFDQMQGLIQAEDSGENMMMLDRDTGIAYDSISDNEYDGINVVGRRAMDASRSGTSFGNREDDSLTVQYSVAKNMDDGLRRTRVKDQDPPAVANTSRKIVNISVNVNTWKPPHYQVSRDVSKVENLKAIQESEVATGNRGVRLMKENNNTVMAVKENEQPGSEMQKESPAILPSTPGSYPTSRPSEDADSRTIFVNNVHFAATKDTLSRHFNKFGEVLKVVIVTDAATGLPKGSAYIEFMRKEAAELALSLNGTSFMSRILKVGKKSSAYQEVTPVMTWPRAARASPFAARLTRVPFPRAQPAFRTRLPIKSGARSLQWKRDSPVSPAVEGSVNPQNGTSLSTTNVPSPTTRSLTYVRTEAKPVGNPGPA